MRLLNFVVGILVGTVFSSALVIAWSGPVSSPPNGNVSPPINVGTTDQVKNAGLSVNALAVFGNAILAGVSNYLNFGNTPGEAGYGIRDNAGVLEFKNASSSWSSLQNTIAVQGSVPVATIVYSAAATPAAGWLKCDGSAVSRTTYAALFAAIGTTYGAGDGATTFNVPDLRGEFIRVLDDGRGVDSGRTLGSFQEGTGIHNYSNNSQMFVGRIANEDGTYTYNTHRAIDGVASTDTNNFTMRRVRPRNVALNAFIKY